MTENPKTILIYLPDGSPRGVRIAEITQHIPKAIIFPRNKMKEAGERQETKKAGIYFLFGTSEETVKPVVYIGESSDCYGRIKQHDQKKDFWNVAIVVTSKADNFTRTHTVYLEWYCLKKARESKRYIIDNTERPKKPMLGEPMEEELKDYYESIKIMLAALNYPIFEEIKRADAKDLLYCKGKLAYAEGEYTDEGLIVFKGSKANLSETPTAGTWVINLRKTLVDEEIIEKEQDCYLFVSDHIFSSPSAAAAAVLGRRANGWLEWKNKEGMTLDSLKRKS